jgi:hypothetical protein
MRAIMGQDKKKQEPKKSASVANDGSVMSGLFEQMPALNALLKERIQVQETSSSSFSRGGGAGGRIALVKGPPAVGFSSEIQF